ncbi:hypothetical protein BCR36DRAFT_273708 [Piromyces finnis]|uniref:SUEL-type lectin domain-containing protein n=1 Tax=Piromyces finnis TaxID=1754191 RepID=A0A1Y1VNZ6_9FUNG|nr:hypothetical protein BCR36DRAFT_273708 [Piromyces finnis]|eukprot:ORX61135.1 hypothetical protein BCR36DRAFT_273708 [Piromyces finnis]
MKSININDINNDIYDISIDIDKNEKNTTLKIPLPEGFVFVDQKEEKGPITVDREKDDKTKLNIYSYTKKSDDSFYYDNKKFETLEDVKKEKDVYFCELPTNRPPEGYKGYDIVCPTYYSIKVNKVFYGRHANDTKHCNIRYGGEQAKLEDLLVNEECVSEPIEYVKGICEGKDYCTLRPGGSHFTDSCPSKHKYLQVKYECVKKQEIKKEKISIVMFSNIIKVNSIYENAISEFYQYASIHGYVFQFNSFKYDTERQVFFMKLNSILEKMITGLKEKNIDWIFWVDSDVILANPNIRLEAFLPGEGMNKIHLIAADDLNGLNAGTFLIRVHPWSLNFLMRAMSYSYYHSEKGLKYADQSSMNNVLVESKEDDHYIVVPQNWFNSYIGLNKDGDFLLHLAGHVNKDTEAKTFRDHICSNKKWYSKSNEEMREEVLKYYSLPKEEQHKIKAE